MTKPSSPASPSISDDADLLAMAVDDDELVENTLQAIWFIPDAIMKKESRNGDSVSVWLRGRYQSENGGVPTKVINIWGLKTSQMRELIDFSKGKPFTMISLIGTFSSLAVQGSMNEVHSLSNAFIEINDAEEWVTEALDPKQCVQRIGAKALTRKELQARQAAKKPLVIDTTRPMATNVSASLEAAETALNNMSKDAVSM